MFKQTINYQRQDEDDNISQIELETKESLSEKNRKQDEQDNLFSKPKRQKAKKPLQSYRRLLQYSFKHKNYLITALVSLLLSSLPMVLMPYLCGKIINTISEEKNMDKLWSWTLLFILVSVAGSFFTFIKSFCIRSLGEYVMFDFRNELYQSILSKDTAFFDVNKSGELMSRITSDTQLIQSATSNNITMVLKNTTQLIGSIMFLWFISWELTLTMLTIIPIVAIFVVIFIRYFKKIKREYQNKLSRANGYATEAIGNIRTIKSFGTEQKEGNLYQNSLHKTFLQGRKMSKIHGMFLAFVQMIAMLSVLIVLYKGGKMVIQGDLQIGDLSSFVLYTIQMSAGLVAIGNVIQDLSTSVGVAEKLFEIMDHPVKIKKGFNIPDKIEGEIEFEKVKFSYPTKDDVVILKEVDFKIQKGQTVALVGQSGSGKTSIISLIERFYDSINGSIKLDGQNIEQIDQQWLHQNIGFVSQEPILFSGTLRQNIIYGIDNAQEEQIQKAIKLANAQDFVNDQYLFPDGLETIVGERGVKLSGGQKQRIAIARAIIKDPKILIFDEATSALDAESEYQVQFAIDQLMKQGGKTIIIIAHRLSTIINCQNIIVLKQGQIVEQGTHQELLKQNNIYAQLISRQLSKDQSQE